MRVHSRYFEFHSPVKNFKSQIKPGIFAAATLTYSPNHDLHFLIVALQVGNYHDERVGDRHSEVAEAVGC
jgi:hypothetical protein